MSAQIAVGGIEAAMQVDTVKPTTLVVNGEKTEAAVRTLAELIAARGFSESEVATALNGEFVPRAARGATLLREGDRVEIVAPRQGG
jgi:sulfur carrier protein